ncbi:YfhD family protein [Bacillus mangrovi]|uniref:YfhD family protein n=1 Tax=Metabacillus mangrovi TaxID=1491830 RepID=A0A7X2V6Z4_9BACI|nr:YfhD family protein [Metabacillus mangrovi]MTH55483.1 YfhD family protein [Metabacillus mangrovi]
MGRGHKQHTRDKNKNGLAQVPKQLKKETDGTYEEFSRELADQADMEAQARANAANQRQKRKK